MASSKAATAFEEDEHGHRRCTRGNKAGFRSVSHLGELQPLLKRTMSAEEYQRSSNEFAKLIHYVMSGTVDWAISEHPTLHAEIDEAIAKHGRYSGPLMKGARP